MSIKRDRIQVEVFWVVYHVVFWQDAYVSAFYAASIFRLKRPFLPIPATSPWRWRQRGPLKRLYPATSLHGVRTQKTSTWSITAAESLRMFANKVLSEIFGLKERYVTNKQIPWSGVLHEKLTVAHIVKKFLITRWEKLHNENINELNLSTNLAKWNQRGWNWRLM
jgi:hypothetical protein